jgi:uncharacterized protein YecE (DUF72 family)
MSRYLTHLKKLKGPEESLQRFFAVFDILKEKMGPVLIQLPSSLQFDESTAENFFSVLKNNYSQYRFALEVRHKSWFSQTCLELLNQYGIAFVISHSNNYFPYAEEITADDIYVRFHGPGKLYDSAYDGDTLEYFGSLFIKWMNKGHTIWAFFNNTMNGQAIQNALNLEYFCMKD